MLLISVLVIAVVGAAYTFVDPFKAGVNDLGRDVQEILGGQSIGGVGRGGSTGNGGSPAPGEGDGTTTNGTTPANQPAGPGLGAPNGSGAPSLNGRDFSANDTFAYDPKAQERLDQMFGPSMGSMMGGGVQTASAPVPAPKTRDA